MITTKTTFFLWFYISLCVAYCLCTEPDEEPRGLFASLVARIDRLEAKLESCDRIHKMEIEKLRHAHQTQMDTLRHDYVATVDGLRNDVTKQAHRMHELETTVIEQKDEITKLLKVLGGTEDTDQQKYVEHPPPWEDPHLLEGNDMHDGTDQSKASSQPLALIHSGKPKFHVRHIEGEAAVAFFATLTNDLLHLGVRQVVTFDNVVTNIGNGYHPHVGEFVAPVSGTYVFSVTLRTLRNHSAHYALYKNLDVVTYMFVNGAESSYDTVSNNVIIHLTQNDDVMIKHVDSDNGLRGGLCTMFSGFLLLPDDSDPSSVIVGK